MKYHVLINGEQSGPFPESMIQLKILSGELRLDDFCWRDGMSEWQPIRSVIKLPPPVSASTDDVHSYYICNNNEQKGPFTETQLRAMWLNGLILASTFYWRDGMAEWRPVAELCDPKPQLGAAKKFIGDAVKAVPSVCGSVEGNISELNNEINKAIAKAPQPSGDTPRQLTTAQKLVQVAYAFFTRLDKTVTRITLLRNPPLPKKLIYGCAAFIVLIMFVVIGSSLNRHPDEETIILSPFGPYPIIGDNVVNTAKRLGASIKDPKTNDEGLSSFEVISSNLQFGFSVFFSGDTVVGFIYLPLKKFMNPQDQDIQCSKGYANGICESDGTREVGPHES